MKSSIKKLVVSLASALMFGNLSVEASDTYVFGNVPPDKQGAVYEFYFPRYLIKYFLSADVIPSPFFFARGILL